MLTKKWVFKDTPQPEGKMLLAEEHQGRGAQHLSKHQGVAI